MGSGAASLLLAALPTLGSGQIIKMSAVGTEAAPGAALGIIIYIFISSRNNFGHHAE